MKPGMNPGQINIQEVTQMKDVLKLVVMGAMAVLLAMPALAAQETRKGNGGGKTVTTPSGLKYSDLVVGKGASPVAG